MTVASGVFIPFGRMKNLKFSRLLGRFTIVGRGIVQFQAWQTRNC